MLGTILLVFALVLAVIATFWPFPAVPAGQPLWGRFNPLAAALAFYFASILFAKV